MHQNTLKNITSFTYGFGDASVPPPYHRSYDITVTKDSIRLTVDSYGDILADKTFPTPPNGLDTIATLLKKHKVALHSTKIEVDDCTGGTSESITFDGKETDERFSGYVGYCGGKTSGTLSGDVRAFSSEFKAAFVPKLREIIRATE